MIAAAQKKTRIVPPAGEAGIASETRNSLRGELKRFTRERLISAAIECFQEQGFRETTVERIVDLAGTTAPTFYRHFSGKDALLLPLQEYLAVEVNACLTGLTAKHIESPAAFRRWIDDYVGMWKRVHRLCKAFWDATAQDGELARESFPRMMGSGDVVERLLPSRNAKDLERLKLRMNLFVLMLDRLAFLVTVSPDEGTSEAMRNEFADIMWTSVFKC